MIANRFMNLAGERLDHMLGFANEGRMIPEQVWDSPEGAKSRFAILAEP